MTETEREYIALACVAAACADGHLGTPERRRIRQVTEELGLGDRDLFRAALERPVSPETLAAALTSPEARRTAYQMAEAVCHADGVLTDLEEAYLSRLREALGISEAAAKGLRLEAEYFTDPGLPPAVAGHPRTEEDLDATILRYAMLAAAAELLPQSIASLVVLPLQVKLVYGIGRRHQVSLDRAQILELAAVFGLGATSQVVESMARRLLGGVARQVGGRMLGGLVGGAASAAAASLLSFCTTYALGHAADVYYAKGRTLREADLRSLFQRFQEDAKTIYPRVEAEIRAQAEKLDAQALLEKVRSLG
jgi:uncharacterized protein (DUF697 family)/uncharacterized tellurite resistance protein B-like protein